MTSDLARIRESKRDHPRALAARPIGEKLRMLNALRERQPDLRNAPPASESVLREESAIYRDTRHG